MATDKGVSITAVCRQLGYSKQAYYKSKSNQQLKACYHTIAKQKVLTIRQQMPRLGTRKLYFLLKEQFKQEHIEIGRDKLFKLLRDEQLLIVKRRLYTKTTNSRHWMHKYPNLIKDIEIRVPEQLWVSDITYIATKEGFVYLHLVTDGYSKQIMGYCVSKDLSASNTTKALQMALKKRKYNTSLIHHSDRGLQYCSAAYVKLLQDNDIKISMTQDGNPYDNAIAERVNGILKDEFGLDEVIENLEQVQKLTSQAIQLYNTKRPHLSCHMLTPDQMHSQTQLTIKKWNKKSTRSLEDSCGFIPLNQY